MAFPSLLKFLIRGSSSGRLLSFTTFHAFGGIRISVSSSSLTLTLNQSRFGDRDLELELGLDRDLGLPLSGAPGGDDGVLDPMSLPGAADDLDGLLDGDLDGVRRVRFEFEFEFEYGDVDDRPYNARLRFLCRCSRYLRLLRSSATLNSFPILVNSRAYLRRVLASTIFLTLLPEKKCIVSIER